MQGTGSIPDQGTRIPGAWGQLSPHALESVLCNQRSLHAATRTQGSQKRTYRFVMKVQKTSSSEACSPSNHRDPSRWYGCSTITSGCCDRCGSSAATPQPPPHPRFTATLVPPLDTAHASRPQSQPLPNEDMNLPAPLHLSPPPLLRLLQLQLYVYGSKLMTFMLFCNWLVIIICP